MEFGFLEVGFFRRFGGGSVANAEGTMTKRTTNDQRRYLLSFVSSRRLFFERCNEMQPTDGANGALKFVGNVKCLAKARGWGDITTFSQASEDYQREGGRGAAYGQSDPVHQRAWVVW